MKLRTILLASLITLNLNALTIGEIPQQVSIANENGGLVKDGGVWSSETIKDKVMVMFYVDPDEKDLNNKFSAALKEKKYNRENYTSLAVINLAASWKPNFAIESALKSKQEEFPDTVYVKDKNRVLVEAWGLRDDSSDVIIFDKAGKVIFQKDGQMLEAEIIQALELIEANI